MPSDMEILKRAFDHENDTRRPESFKSWEAYAVGIMDRATLTRLMDEELITVTWANASNTIKKYKLTEKGNKLVWSTHMEHEFKKIPFSSLQEAMDLVIGWDDIKERIALAIANNRQAHFLLSGPPACAKSVILEAVRNVVPDAAMVFGSRTSASGLSDLLFEKQPRILLFDEMEKAHNDAYSVMLGLMEKGEVLETKSMKTRGIVLKTMVIAACNKTDKLPRETLSRFGMKIRFPEYTRDEFVEVSEKYMARAENCPPDVARYIGERVFDNQLGDIRQCRGVWQNMYRGDKDEVDEVIAMMMKYQPDLLPTQKRQRGSRMMTEQRSLL